MHAELGRYRMTERIGFLTRDRDAVAGHPAALSKDHPAREAGPSAT
jgi:hypothetical protein